MVTGPTIFTSKKRIGDFLRDRGLLSEAQLRQTVEYAQTSGLRLGDAAVDLGFIRSDDLARLFGPHHRVPFFTLDPRYFPESTRELIPVSELLTRGILPLGFKSERRFFKKRKTLNIGLLEPSPIRIRETEKWVLSNFTAQGFVAVRCFLILGDGFLGVMERVYGLDERKIREAFPIEKLDRTLALYLEE